MRNIRRKRAPLVLAVTVALVATACGGGRDDADDGGTAATTEPAAGDTEGTEGTEQAACGEPSTGISDGTVLIGGSYPLSGPASAYGAIPSGVEAYFAYANAELGGAPVPFEGRELEYSVKDDGYSPPQAVELVRELVEQQQVFALMQTLGTPPTAATWDYTNEQEVPQVFVATGATMFGLDAENHPWTIGWQPNYVSEARIYAQYLLDNHPDATVAVLYQNDDYGMDYLEGFKDAIEGSGIEIVAEQSYETTDPTVESQMTNLAQSGAEVFFNITTPSFAAQAMGFDAQSDWDPIHLLNSVSNSLTTVGAVGFEPLQGMVTALYLKDPQDPQWEGDEDMQTYLENIGEYAPNADPNNGYVVYGWAVGSAFYKLLEQTECPTRESLMEATMALDGVEFDLALPGVTMNTSEDDRFPLEVMQIATLEGEAWKLEGEVIDTREVFGPVGDAVE
jgi:branched-chain amino acid transport system substrate-binding protein